MLRSNSKSALLLLIAFLTSTPACRDGNGGCTPETGRQVETKAASRITPPPLIAAIFDGDLERVRSLLDQGADVSALSEISPSATMIAMGMELPSDMRIGMTPLLAAAFVDNPEIITLLLSRGADPTVASAQGMTPVMLALDTQHWSAADAIIVHEPGTLVATTPVTTICAWEPRAPDAVPVAADSRFSDNGDGTITDNATDLMWEQKCSVGSGLHYFKRAYVWSGDGEEETVWDWLADVNQERGIGFAGYSDWRLPNVKELQSLIDFQRFLPATAAIFDGSICHTGCDNLLLADCTCTSRNPYWTSTTFADFPESALAVNFGFGRLTDVTKTNHLFVRAVRDARPQAETAPPPPPRETIPPPLEVELPPRRLGLAVDPLRQHLWWTEHDSGRVGRANTDGSGAQMFTIDGVRDPVDIAVAAEGNRIFLTTDGYFTRRLLAVDTETREVTEILDGFDLNRPAAITFDDDLETLFWSEHVSGRIRRASVDGDDLRQIADSGISSDDDRAGQPVFMVLGLSLDGDAGLYWTDFISGTVQRGDEDGSESQVIVGGNDGTAAPIGIVIDRERQRILWADRVSGILQAGLDGSNPRPLITREGGALAPYALALDPSSNKLYWTDIATGDIARSDIDGGGFEVVVAAAARAEETGVAPGSACDAAIRDAGNRFAADVINIASTCLEKLAGIHAVKRRPVDVRAAAPACTALLRRLADGGPGLSPDRLLKDAAAAQCAAVETRRLGLCDERSGSLGEWITCVSDHYRAVAYAAIGRRYPRAQQRLDDIRPFIVPLRTPAGDAEMTRKALPVVDALRAAVAAPEAPVPLPVTRGLPASGQQTSYAAWRRDTRAPGPVPDDGMQRAGAPLRYRDNGDGTISDVSTGLMWERKCDGCGGLHDMDNAFTWQETGADPMHAGWIAKINAEGRGGFAGYDDWRIPSAHELLSIVDYERFNPAVGVAFDGPGCGAPCDDVTSAGCTCASLQVYWTSTQSAPSPDWAFGVSFNIGLLTTMPTAAELPVRAVRGGPYLASTSGD